ncbi:MAG: hypothetical protein VW127_01620 [Flavobacteriaceae bacterium]|jgi:hypothetical protein
MNKIAKAFIGLIIFSNAFSQSDQEEQIDWPKEPLPMYQVTEIFPKSDYISEFVNEINIHIDKFYRGADKGKAYLRKVVAGGQIHKFYWIKGPISTDEYDQIQINYDKTTNWNKNVAKYIKEYGNSNFYRYATPLSTQSKGSGISKYAKIWRMKFKDGENVTEEAFQMANKIKKARESVGLTYHIYWPIELMTKGWKMDIVETAENLKDLYDSDIDLKGAYEKIFGENSFSEFWKKWDGLLELESTELRVLVR